MNAIPLVHSVWVVILFGVSSGNVLGETQPSYKSNPVLLGSKEYFSTGEKLNVVDAPTFAQKLDDAFAGSIITVKRRNENERPFRINARRDKRLDLWNNDEGKPKSARTNSHVENTHTLVSEKYKKNSMHENMENVGGIRHPRVSVDSTNTPSTSFSCSVRREDKHKVSRHRRKKNTVYEADTKTPATSRRCLRGNGGISRLAVRRIVLSGERKDVPDKKRDVRDCCKDGENGAETNRDKVVKQVIPLIDKLFVNNDNVGVTLLKNNEKKSCGGSTGCGSMTSRPVSQNCKGGKKSKKKPTSKCYSNRKVSKPNSKCRAKKVKTCKTKANRCPKPMKCKKPKANRCPKPIKCKKQKCAKPCRPSCPKPIKHKKPKCVTTRRPPCPKPIKCKKPKCATTCRPSCPKPIKHKKPKCGTTCRPSAYAKPKRSGICRFINNYREYKSKKHKQCSQSAHHKHLKKSEAPISLNFEALDSTGFDFKCSDTKCGKAKTCGKPNLCRDSPNDLMTSKYNEAHVQPNNLLTDKYNEAHVQPNDLVTAKYTEVHGQPNYLVTAKYNEVHGQPNDLMTSKYNEAHGQPNYLVTPKYNEANVQPNYLVTAKYTEVHGQPNYLVTSKYNEDHVQPNDLVTAKYTEVHVQPNDLVTAKYNDAHGQADLAAVNARNSEGQSTKTNREWKTTNEIKQNSQNNVNVIHIPESPSQPQRDIKINQILENQKSNQQQLRQTVSNLQGFLDGLLTSPASPTNTNKVNIAQTAIRSNNCNKQLTSNQSLGATLQINTASGFGQNANTVGTGSNPGIYSLEQKPGIIQINLDKNALSKLMSGKMQIVPSNDLMKPQNGLCNVLAASAVTSPESQVRVDLPIVDLTVDEGFTSNEINSIGVKKSVSRLNSMETQGATQIENQSSSGSQDNDQQKLFTAIRNLKELNSLTLGPLTSEQNSIGTSLNPYNANTESNFYQPPLEQCCSGETPFSATGMTNENTFLDNNPYKATDLFNLNSENQQADPSSCSFGPQLSKHQSSTNEDSHLSAQEKLRKAINIWEREHSSAPFYTPAMIRNPSTNSISKPQTVASTKAMKEWKMRLRCNKQLQSIRRKHPKS